jgi:hypothetical protein
MRDLESQNPTLDGQPVAATDDALKRSQPWLRRLNYDQSPQAREQLAKDLAGLRAEAKDDHHDVMAPTHIVEQDGKIIGYASIGAIPMVNLWLSSKQQRPRDAMSLLNMVENAAAAGGFQVICVPCGDVSPFRKLMNRFGYNYLMESGFFTKKLRG